jgi:hypothetical protein
MTDVTCCNPHKEEDEGYLAAAAGLGLSANAYPSGTIRYEHWRRGWRTWNDEASRAIRLGTGNGHEDEGYQAAETGKILADNPYPCGTIRYEHWRRGWRIKSDETQRDSRLDGRPRVDKI